MSLNVVNVGQAVRHAQQPFALIELAAVGEIAVHGYVCLGAVNWHKHIDHDEAFLVHEGAMVLESELGQMMLRAGEVAVVPKGIAHRSGSQLRTLVILMRTRGLPERKNGQRRLFGLRGKDRLAKIRLQDVVERAAPFCLEPVTRVDEYALRLARGDGLSPTYLNNLSDTLWLTLDGQVHLEAGDETIELAAGEMAVVARDVPHCWIGSHSTLLWLGLLEPAPY